MSDLRTAAKQALEALWTAATPKSEDAITALRAALAADPVLKPEPPPEAQTEAEKIAYCAGWWAALEKARKAERMPKGCTTPSGCQQHGCHGECLPAPPKLDKGPVVAQISPNITSAIEEWKQLGGEIIRNEPPSAQLPPLPKNLHSLAGNIWCSICEWADAEPGAEASAAAKQINKALEEEMIAYAKQALRLNGVNV